MVEGPVPVVVVKVAELLGARVDFTPQLPVEGHPHVVLGTDPLGDLNLKGLCGDAFFMSLAHCSNPEVSLRKKLQEKS